MLLFTAVFLFAACGQRPSEKLELNLEPVDVYELQISSEIINEIIQNIASPIEVAAQINALNVPYSTQYLTDAESLSTSTSSFEMAYSLGALNANLVYLNMYEKTGSAVIFLSSINRLADALQIGQFFDYDTIKRLATSSSDLDSLMFISVNSFNNMETYLRETDRSNLSSLMIAGVWIEGLYLSTQVAKLNSNEDLRAMIGEQKLILNDLLLILNKHKNEKIIADYIKDFELIKTVFDEVKITFEVGEPRTIEKDGNLIVVQSEFSQVSMSDETLQKIIEITEQVRNTHVNKKA
jgi:hypothetical protein